MTGPTKKQEPRKVSVLGATGSIGRNTVDLLCRDRDAYSVVALSAQSNVSLLIEQVQKLRPEIAVIGDSRLYPHLKQALARSSTKAACGAEGLDEAAAMPCDVSVCAIVGAAGLQPTMTASQACRVLAIANKESLVCSGAMIADQCRKNGVTIIPVDSEHSAIFQIFDSQRPESIDKIILTASGGPFRDTPIEDMQKITPRQALQHPSWNMGAKISIDSATMMNKALEIIEAHFLFAFPHEKIEVIIHPQSIVHSCVSYRDGAVLAHMGMPDMRTPISYALSWPRRMATPVEKLDLAKIGQLVFHSPDEKRFPALALVRHALTQEGSSLVVLNAANEIAVDAFLRGQLAFCAICSVVEETMQKASHHALSSIRDVLAVDAEARHKAREEVAHYA